MDLTPGPEIFEAAGEAVVELAARGSADEAGDDCFAPDRIDQWWSEPQRRMYRGRARVVIGIVQPLIWAAAYRVGREDGLSQFADECRSEADAIAVRVAATGVGEPMFGYWAWAAEMAREALKAQANQPRTPLAEVSGDTSSGTEVER